MSAMESNRRRPLWHSFALHIALICTCIVTLYPVLWVVKLAVSPKDKMEASANPLPDMAAINECAASTPDGSAIACAAKNFTAVTTTTARGSWLFGRQLLNSVLVSTLSTLIGLALAVTAAYALSRFKFPGKEQGMQALLVTQMFPGTLMLVSLYSILQHLGLLDSLTGLVLVYSTTSLPFCVWMLKGYFDTIPRELEEAATMDGASPLQTFVRVVLPLAKPALAVTALFSFLNAWNEYILAATLLNDQASFTLPVALKRYMGEYTVEWGKFGAGALIVSIPVMALFFALQKHLVGGLTAGGVKG